jgi:hypothetical protein
MLVAAWSALSTVQPGMFFLPGNNPANWLPEHWKCVGTDRKKMQRARYEQAEQISRHIAENAENAKLRAMKMTRSFEWAKRTIWISGALLFGAMVYRAMGFDAEGLLHWGGAAFHTICGN